MAYARTQIFFSPRLRRTLRNVKFCSQQLSLIEGNSYWVIPCVQQALNKRYPFWLRIFWTLVLIVSFSLCAYQISARFAYFFTYPVAVDIRLVKALRFPSFTVCSQDTVKIVEMGEKYRSGKQPGLVECLNMLFGLLAKVENVSVDRLWEYTDSKTLLEMSVLEMGSRRGVEQTVTVPPVKTDTPMGTCMTFHVDAQLNGRETESRFTMKFNRTPGSCKFSMISGSIQEPGQKLSNLRNLFSISPLVILHAYFAYKQYEFLDTPLKHCVDQDLYDECEYQCFMHAYRNQSFPCRFPFMPSELNLPFCIASNETHKLYSITAEMYLRLEPSLSCKCLPRCHKTVFDPALNLIATGQNHTTFVISLRDSHAIVIRERFAYDFIELMCDIGGNVGLYFGLSVLSILDFIKTIVFSLIGRRRLQKRQCRRLVKITSHIYYKELAKKKISKRGTSNWFTLIYLFCFCFALFQIISRINYQLTQPTHVIVKVKENRTVSFPSLTICAPSASYKRFCRNLTNSNKIKDTCEVTDILQFYDIPVTPKQVWSAKDIKSTIMDIHKLAQESFGLEPLKADNLTSVDTPFGNCIHYDIGNHEFTGTSSIFMFLTVYQMTVCDMRTEIYITPPGRSLNPSSLRRLVIGGKNAVMYTVRQVVRINTSRRPCANASETYKCREECLIEKIKKNITCSLPFMYDLDQPPCTSWLTARETLDKYLKFFFEPCKKCIQPCIEDIYETRIYVEPFGERQTFYTNFFVHSAIEYIEEIHIYGYVQLFCDVGAIMGLMLGLCVATMFETVQEFLASVYNNLF